MSIFGPQKHKKKPTKETHTQKERRKQADNAFKAAQQDAALQAEQVEKDRKEQIAKAEERRQEEEAKVKQEESNNIRGDLLSKWLDTLDLLIDDVAMKKKIEALDEMIKPVIKLKEQRAEILDQAGSLIKEVRTKHQEIRANEFSINSRISQEQESAAGEIAKIKDNQKNFFKIEYWFPEWVGQKKISAIETKSSEKIVTLEGQLKAIAQEKEDYGKSSLSNLKDEIKNIASVVPLTNEEFKEKNELAAKERVAAMAQAERKRLEKVKVKTEKKIKKKS